MGTPVFRACLKGVPSSPGPVIGPMLFWPFVSPRYSRLIKNTDKHHDKKRRDKNQRTPYHLFFAACHCGNHGKYTVALDSPGIHRKTFVPIREMAVSDQAHKPFKT